MEARINWIDIIKGSKVERFSTDDPTIVAIGFNPETGHPMIEKEDGSTISAMGCPFIVSASPKLIEEAPGVVVPKLEVAS